ncbi:MAG: hypothetical protein KBD01_09160 [Acidobacteria bacterium]|nr:hypothetical protein [Acidobacteriota bacterium]
MRTCPPSIVLVAALAACAASAGPPVHVEHDFRVTFDVRLTLRAAGRTLDSAEDRLAGPAGEPLPFAHQFAGPRGPISVGLSLAGTPDADAANCRLEIDTDVQPRGRAPQRSTRRIVAGPERLVLLELWNDREDDARLLLAVTPRWEAVPRVVVGSPAPGTIDLIVQVLQGEGPNPVLLERHQLPGVIGEPVRYEVRSAGAASANLVLEITPESLADGAVRLALRLRHEGGAAEDAAGRFDIGVRDVLASGSPLELPLPRHGDDPPLVFRVTPIF